VLTAWSALWVAFISSRGWLLYSGDAEAHLDIARRMVDSRTPGYDQVGTAWLPLEHWLTVPFAGVDAWWQSGLAGAIPSALCFVVAGCFLFAAARRIFQSAAAGWTATVLVALNPNLLYLQSTAMTEAVFYACLAALLYFTVRFRESQGWPSVIGAGLAACAGTLTRYEGWFLLPCAAVYFLWVARRRVVVAVVFCLIAGLGPLFWLAHNWWLGGDPLAFYRGPYSARAIQGAASFPGRDDWSKAVLFFRTAAELCCGTGLVLVALGGLAAALFKRVFWPLVLLALPGAFYVWSVHSGAVPIFVPSLWFGSYYNTRYGLAVLPLLALAAAGLVAVTPPGRARAAIAVLAIAAGSAHWLAHPRPEDWIVWQESNVNDRARREAVREAAEYLGAHYVRGTGIFTSFGGALTAVYRELGIPLRDTFTGDNGLAWDAAAARPDLVLREPWGVALAGDAAEAAILRAGCYRLEKSILVKGAREIRIYRRAGENRDPS